MPVLCLESFQVALLIYNVFYVAGCWVALLYCSSKVEKILLTMFGWGILCQIMVWFLAGNLTSVCKVG